MTDNISAVLQTISASLNSVNSAFESVYNTAANDIDSVGLDVFKAQIEAATERTAALQDQLQGIANVQWDSGQRIEIFQNTGIERFQDEMQSLTDITSNFLERQAEISVQAASMNLLPPNATADIEATNQRIQELGERMAAMQSMDVSMLDDTAIARLNAEYEGMRGNLNNLINLQENMNTAIEQGDFSAMNRGFNQLNDAAESFEKRIRDNTHALQEMANIEWVSASNIEIFNGNDAERFKNEVEAANDMMRQMTYTQEQISVQAASMNLLPPNAIADISGMGDRIAALRSRIEEVQQSRIEVVGASQANSEVEQLRGQLQQAMTAQEDMNRALNNMDASGANRAYQQLNAIVNQTERNIRDNINRQSNFNDEVVNGKRAASGLKGIVAGIAGAFTVRAGVAWIRESVNMTNENIRLEQQLANVMANRGATQEEYNRLLERASQIQADTGDMISSTTMMGAANELARHVGSIDAIEIMMDSLADFAAGAGNIFGATAEDMAAYAEYFTQAMAGNYRMLERRAGIYLTEIQKDVIKYGDDMQRALMIQDIVNQSWAGLAEQMAATPEGMQAGMINAFNDIRSAIGAQLLPVIMILFQTIQSHMPQIEAMFQGLIPVLQFLIGIFSTLIDVAFMVSSVIMDNWGFIEPMIWGIAAALAAWKIATVLVGIAKLVKTMKVWALNAALIKKNALLFGIPVIIGAIVTGIMFLVDSIGGWRVAWLYTVNAILTAWDWVKIGFFTGVHFVMDLWSKMALGMQMAGTSIANFMGDMRANVLMILQNMVNGAIDLINSMITTLNRIPGVNIGIIEQVSFGAQAQLENEAARQARNAALENYAAEVEAGMAERAAMREQMRADAREATADRLAEIHAIRAVGGYETDYTTSHSDFVHMMFDGNEGFGTLGRDVSDIAAHTGDMANISDENLKYWRDIAERNNINRFTTARVNLTIPSITNQINNNMDLDDVVEYIVDGVEEGLETTAERTNDYV